MMVRTEMIPFVPPPRPIKVKIEPGTEKPKRVTKKKKKKKPPPARRKRKKTKKASTEWGSGAVVISPDATSPLLEYMALPSVSSYRMDMQKMMHSYTNAGGATVWCGGIHSYMEGIRRGRAMVKTGRYLPPDYVPAKRTHWSRKKSAAREHKKGSTREEGNACMNAIEATVSTGGIRPKRINKYATAALDWLGERGYTLQAAEVPVFFPGINKATRIDLITLDRNGQHYVLWEIKCGWPPGADRGKFKMNVQSLSKVSCSAINMYHMQALYNKVGAHVSGMTNISCTKVLHVFEAEVVTRAGEEPVTKKSRKGVKETWDKKVGVIENDTGTIHRLMRVIAYDQPRWSLDYEPSVMRRAGRG